MNTFTTIFLTLLAVMLLAQLWLARRHARYIAAHRGAVPAAFRGKVPLKAHRKAADYTVARTRFGAVEDVLAAALLLAWTLGGGLEWLDRLWRASGLGELATGTGFLVSVFVIMALIELPTAVYQTFVLESRFGFNRVTPALFVADLLKKTVLMMLLGIPVAAAVLWVMQETGTLWWFYAWLLWVGFSLFMIWAYPTLIAPLFHRFTPLKQGDIRRRIHALLKRTGFRSRGVFVIDSSRRTTHGNAYFSGLGRAKRIVFFDSLLKTLSVREIEAVLAHELGHFKLSHVLKRMALLFAMSFAGLAALGWLMTQDWFYRGLGVAHPSAHAALMLFLLVGPVFSFFLQPLLAWGSRRHEYEADGFAAEETSARALVNALVKLYKENASTLTPDPLHSAFYDSHPPAARRIARLLGKL
ncbi:MAG: peptidase M48 [Candidatus Muproteobacteria bacterium RBG_16_65_34]|uniref:Peptidase M48 n=1 Tax=Candidatus Muproteobacteria bacterium RBG_16_65_34 TaxID=1817760 RepID=A0A1F6TKB9_9PROT|nr:MAG: peptidase M48 [Candidatus Muproteobacteria bacterium RBG_16_65_34]